MYSTETEIYSLATCPGTKYSGDNIVLRATPRDGIGPYYVAFKKSGIIIDPSRLGGESNPITNAPENIEITRTYTLDDADVRNALTGTIDFSVFIRGACPTGGGLQFDGINDYVDAGNAASLNIINSITVSTWVNAPSGSSGTRPQIVGKQQAYEHGWLIAPDSYGPYYNLIFYFVSGDEFYISTVLQYNRWYHIVVTYNGTTALGYIDGVQTASYSRSGTIFSTNQPLQVGYNNGRYSYFNGTIDEVRIYNRALSPTEILGLYNGSTPRNGLVLEHIYSLGNANDLSGYGNNGTPVNGPVFIPNACMDTCTVAIGCIAPVCNFVVT